MKPAAPVTRIRSSGPIMKQSCGGDPLSRIAMLVPKAFIMNSNANPFANRSSRRGQDADPVFRRNATPEKCRQALRNLALLLQFQLRVHGQ